MTSFVWTDRDGRRHEVDSPALIEAEAATIAREMDRYVDLLDGADRLLRDQARRAIGSLRTRLAQLRADLADWNSYAIAIAREEATALADQIDRLPSMIADVLLVVEAHGEHNRFTALTASAIDMAARMLAEPMTATQRRAIESCRSRDAPVAPSRGEAKAWLDRQPRFARAAGVNSGWFAWIDRNGHAHRLGDPLTIEREIAAIGKDLAELRPGLAANTDPAALFAAVDMGFASWARLSVLQADLERFDREATAREDTAWTNYAADWRSKRKST